MDRMFVRCTVAAAIAAFVGVAPPAKAEITMVTEVVFQSHCSNAEGSPHPRRIEAMQPIVNDSLARFDAWALFVGYVGFPDGAGAASFETTAGVKQVTVDVLLAKADGSEENLGRFRGRIARDGSSSVGRIVERTLERGDVLHWRLSFKGTRKLPPGACFITVMGYAQPDGPSALPTLSALGL